MSSSTISNNSRTILIENGSEQHSQHQHNSQQSAVNQSSSEQQLQRLKQSLQMSKQQLIQVTNKNQFTQKVFCFNNEAKKLIEVNKIEQALVYLNEAEKILQYAASSGKNIERKTIIQVLHNQACCYQILWDLEKCSNYIEALIFNFNSELKFGDFPQSSHPSQIHMSSSKKSLSAYSRIESQKFDKQVQLAKYYLLYCAINSQLKNNQGALIAAKKASQITKDVIQQLLDIYEEQKQNNTSSIQNLPPFVYPMLQQIPKIATSINTNKTDQLLCLVRHYIKIYNSKCVFNNLSASKGFYSNVNTKQVYQKYKNFSIGNMMQLQPVEDTSQSSKNILQSSQYERINYPKLIQKLIVFSICQFTMATQLRYIALNNAKNDKEQSHQTIEFKQSQAYHLLGVLIVAMYMPFDIIYMEHIISSYHGHYKTVLLSNGLDGTPELNQDDIKRIKETVVFAHKESNLTSTSSRKQQDMKKCSTTNQSNESLIVSFHQQDEDDDSRQPTNKKSKQSSHKKSSHNKQNHRNSFIHDQNDLSQSEKHLFDQYYYVKKNTEPDHGLAYEENASKICMRNVKSKSRGKKVSGKSSSKKHKNTNTNSNSRSKIYLHTQESIQSKENKPNKKQPRKSKSKSKNSLYFDSKPSTIFVPSENQKDSGHRFQSQMTPQMAHSPLIVPQIYSKITRNSKSKQLKSKENKKKSENKNGQIIKQQSEYFTNCNFVKKVDNKADRKCQNNQVNNHKKSRSNKKPLDTNRKDPIKTQYFHMHDPNIIKDTKVTNKKLTKNEGGRKSSSRGKQERLSSKSLHKAMSPNGLSKKCNIKGNSKMTSQMSKQKRSRQTEGLGSIYLRSAISGNRQSVSSKKSERRTINKLSDQHRLVTQQAANTMKASHFNKYYL